MDHCELKFVIQPLLPAREVLIAELAEMGFESFVEEPDGLKAYISGDGPDDAEIRSLAVFSLPETTVSFEKSLIPRENWNAKWESDFNPIFVDDRVSVRAPFHPETGADFDLVIQPKMSFGTGHHETTWLMLRCMCDLDFAGKDVLDMGSGTGVLAILAEKLGAKSITAIDIDDWAKENAEENALLNHCVRIRALIGDAELLTPNAYDIILANINRNVLVADMPAYVKSMRDRGDIILSGFFCSDIPRLRAETEKHGFELINEWNRGDWACLHFRR